MARADTWRGGRLLCLGLTGMLGVSLALPLLAPRPATAGTRTHLTLSAIEEQTLREINSIRRAHGLASLAPEGTLLAAASAHAEEMTDTGTFSHQGPGGESFSARFSHYVPATDEVGENLMWGVGAFDSSAIVRAWMRSPEHRANLLRPEWRHVGVSIRTVASAPGVYGGAPVTVVVADFDVQA